MNETTIIPAEEPVKKKRGRKKKEKNVRAIDTLSDRHKIFVKNYVACVGNGTRAYKETYPNVTTDTAKVNASKLLTNTNIKQAIQDEFDGGLPM